VARGPDLLWGGRVENARPPAGRFDGVIGGSPCQDFSAARRAEPTGEGRRLMAQFGRVVLAADPDWWLLENVPRAPNVVDLCPGLAERYPVRQRIDVDQSWYCPVSRLRHFQFGAKGGLPLDIPKGRPQPGAEPAAMACDGRTFREVCRLQGLPDDFDLPGFLATEKIRAVGNGVPIAMGRVVARAVLASRGLLPSGHAHTPISRPAPLAPRPLCRCGCGRPLYSTKKRYDSAACRKRAERARRRSSVA